MIAGVQSLVVRGREADFGGDVGGKEPQSVERGCWIALGLSIPNYSRASQAQSSRRGWKGRHRFAARIFLLEIESKDIVGMVGLASARAFNLSHCKEGIECEPIVDMEVTRLARATAPVDGR